LTPRDVIRRMLDASIDGDIRRRLTIKPRLIKVRQTKLAEAA
jgi:hypothetical protein